MRRSRDDCAWSDHYLNSSVGDDSFITRLFQDFARKVLTSKEHQLGCTYIIVAGKYILVVLAL